MKKLICKLVNNKNNIPYVFTQVSTGVKKKSSWIKQDSIADGGEGISTEKLHERYH